MNISRNYERSIPLIEEYKAKRDELASFEKEVNARKKKLAELKKENEEKFNFETHDEIRKLEDALNSANQAYKQEEQAFKNIEKRTGRQVREASKDYFLDAMKNDEKVTSTKDKLNELVNQGLELIDTYDNKKAENANKALDHFENELDYTGSGLDPAHTYNEDDKGRLHALKRALEAYINQGAE